MGCANPVAPTVLGYIFLNYFIKNPQTRNARAFLPLNISIVGSVYSTEYKSLFQISSRAQVGAFRTYRRKSQCGCESRQKA